MILSRFSRRALSLNRLGTGARCISSSKITVQLKNDDTAFKNRPKKEDLAFGQTISDHMFMVEWNTKKGWNNERIVPYEDLRISPAASCLHYGRIIASIW